MLHIVKNTNLINKRIAFLCGLLVAVVLALLPISAGAQCSKWNVSGKWSFWQQGQKRPIHINLEQKDKALSGNASHIIPGSGNLFGSFGEDLTGVVKGLTEGDSIHIEISWGNGQTGVYTAKFLPSGKLVGEGWEKKSPNVRVTWQSEGVFKCAPRPPGRQGPFPAWDKNPPKTPPPSKPPTSQPTKPAPPPPLMKVPGIITSQVIYPYPNVPTGFIILTWDAGPDHPYAEVWFKIGGPTAPATFLVEQGKGSRQIPVERYKYYSYTLTDAGKTLAEVTFVAQ